MKISGKNLITLLIVGAFLKACGPNTPSTTTQRTSPVTSTSRQSTVAAPPATSSTLMEQRLIRYIGPKSLNVRATENGRVVSSLPHGHAVTIYAESNGWSRISAENQPAQWVSSEHLCVQTDCSDIRKWMTPPATMPRPAVPRSSYSDTSTTSSCPCSSSRNCYGPRGGRYCITSGGNKRYR